MNRNEALTVQRTHDAFYLDENRYSEPKEMFKFIAEHAFVQSESNSSLSICDFGCAAGEFLYYLNSILPKANLTGVDVMPVLLSKAAKFVPSAEFKEGSVLDGSFGSESLYDKSFLIGVHSIFDEFETCFTNLVKWTKPGGCVYIVGMFNPFPVDVLVKYKESKNYESNMYESGWNIFSQQSVSEFLKKNEKVKSLEFKKFSITIDLPRQADPVRSWTLRDFREDRFIVNGLCLIQPHYLLEIKL
jgi:SAM-dependent methyltransferase